MPVCDSCKSFHVLGKKTAHGNYCNDKCLREGQLKLVANTVPPGYIDQRVAELHQGNCPRCSGPGPIDLHSTHEVWSAVVLTSWKSIPALSCKSCGVKRQLGAFTFCTFLGWWGFPFGLIVTPIQLIRNLVGMIGGPSPNQPSRLLVETVTRMVASQLPAAPAAPPLPTGSAIPPALPNNLPSVR